MHDDWIRFGETINLSARDRELLRSTQAEYDTELLRVCQRLINVNACKPIVAEDLRARTWFALIVQCSTPGFFESRRTTGAIKRWLATAARYELRRHNRGRPPLPRITEEGHDTTCDLAHEEATRVTTAKKLPRLIVHLSTQNYFMAVTWVLRDVCQAEYPVIIEVLENAIRPGPERLAEVKCRVVTGVNGIEQPGDYADRIVGVLEPSRRDAEVLAEKLRLHGSAYWRYEGNPHGHVKGWAHQIRVGVRGSVGRLTEVAA